MWNVNPAPTGLASPVSPHHRQIREAGKVLVDWWPGKGTCIMHTPGGDVRGPKCTDFEAMLAWLRSV